MPTNLILCQNPRVVTTNVSKSQLGYGMCAVWGLSQTDPLENPLSLYEYDSAGQLQQLGTKVGIGQGGVYINNNGQVINDGPYYDLNGQPTTDLCYGEYNLSGGEIGSRISYIPATRFQSKATTTASNVTTTDGDSVQSDLDYLDNKAKAVNYVTPEQFQSSNDLNYNAAFEAAAQAVVNGEAGFISAQGEYNTIPPYPDMQGVDIIGSDPIKSKIDGYVKNVGRITNIGYGEVELDTFGALEQPRTGILPACSNDNKSLAKLGLNDNTWVVGMQSEFKEDMDVGIFMRRGNGGDGPDWEHIRSQQIYTGTFYNYVSIDDSTYDSTEYSDLSYTPIQLGFPDDTGSTYATEIMHIQGLSTTTAGAAVEIELSCFNQNVNVAVALGYSSTRNAVISIKEKDDSGNYSGDWIEKKTVDLRKTITGVRVRTVEIDTGYNENVMLKIENGDVEGQSLRLLGFNLHRPKQSNGAYDYTNYALYFYRPMHYSATVGAGDYALQRDGVGFFGSYHGHEVALQDPEWRVNGEIIETFTTYKPYVGKIIDLFEKTQLINEINTDIYQRFDGNSSHHINMTLRADNPFRLDKAYLGMNGTFETFTRIFMPSYHEGVTGADNPDVLLGMSNLVGQENPTTGQVVYTFCNTYMGLPSAKGGLFVKTTDETGGSYQKVYFSWIYKTETYVNNLSFQLKKVFA